MIILSPPVKIETKVEEIDFETLLKEVMDNMELPIGVSYKIRGNKVELTASDQIIGSTIITPINEELIKNIDKQIQDVISR